VFRNYLVMAWRNLARHRLYGFITIAGLAVGLACAIFILLFLRDELSWDRWIPDSENLYRIESTFHRPGGDHDFFAAVPFPLTPAMQADFPEVLAQTHITPEAMTAGVGDRMFSAAVVAVDTNFFQFLRLPFVRGNPATALAQPESIVLTQSAARKYFGTADPVGRTVLLAGKHNLVVTGVLRDLPHNTHLDFEMVMPNTSAADIMPASSPARTLWLNFVGPAYIKLAPHTDLAALERKLVPMLDKNIDARKQMGLDMRGSALLQLHITPLRDIHLAPYGESENGKPIQIYGFAAIALLILLIACFNYMNLATARAMVRAREIALRKVVGARRGQLVMQLMGESVMTALVALILALGIVEPLLPAYDGFLARPIAYDPVADWPLTLGFAAIAVGAGVLGGIYPALLLSGFRPAARLGTAASGIGDSGLLRAGLVVVQFAISIGLGIAMIVMFAQIRHARQTDLGFDRHNLVVLGSVGSLPPATRESLRRALAAEPSIAGVTQSNMTPFSGRFMVDNFTVPGRTGQFVLRDAQIDPDFLGVYGMKLLAGRNFSSDRGQDAIKPPDPKNPDANTNPQVNILISAAAARLFGFTPQQAVGRHINQGKFGLNIVGVVGDTNFDGIRTAIPPFLFFYDPLDMSATTVRIKPGQNLVALAAVDRIWHRFVPTVTIARRFQDESFDRLFAADETQDAIFALFVGIAIFIACLGLFGLASFTAERRTREIGIRKIFGARSRDIVGLLLWQFSIPVLVANLLAWPVAWYYLRHWLEGYADRISLNPLYFLAAGMIALAIAWATVVVHAWLTARANPIHALRYE
jgi:putative ABC transport system permease protein